MRKSMKTKAEKSSNRNTAALLRLAVDAVPAPVAGASLVLALLAASVFAPSWIALISAASQSAAPARFSLGGNAAEVPAEFVGNLVFLPVRVNDNPPLPFILDTNALATAIAPINASAATQTSPAATLHLPGVDVPFSFLPVVERRDFGAEVGRRFEGALGDDFLARVVVEIDYSRQTVRFYDPAAYAYSGKGAKVPLAFLEGKPIVRAKFSGHRGPEEADFEVATALDDAIVFSEPFADAHKLVSSRATAVSAFRPGWTDSPANALGRIKAFQLGPYAAQELLAVFSQKRAILQGHPNVAGFLGGGLLRRFTVIFDFPRQQLILEPHFHIGDYDDADMSGLAIVARGSNLKTFEIAGVEPHSPAAEAGIQKGDVIAGIDNEAAADLSLAGVRDLFHEPAHKYKLLVERNGRTLTIEIKTRRLI